MIGAPVNAIQRSRIDPAGLGAEPPFPRQRESGRRSFAGAALASALLLALAGCVTINIYFPAAAAEKAADKIIDEVWQLDPKRGSAGEKPPSN